MNKNIPEIQPFTYDCFINICNDVCGVYSLFFIRISIVKFFRNIHIYTHA